MTQPEIDWGDGAHPARSWESDEARRVRQAKHARELEWQATLRKRARIRFFVGVPLALLFLAACTAIGLDYSGVVAFGIFDHSAPVTIPAAPPVPVAGTRSEPPPAPIIAVTSPETPQAEPIALAPEPAPMDLAQVAKLKDRLAHAQNGVGVISRERAERLGMLAQEDQLLRGSYNPDAAHRRRDSLYDQNRANAVRALQLQSAAAARQPGAEAAYSSQLTIIQNVQAQIQDTINHEAHDAEVLRSLNERLAKAQAEVNAITAQLPP